MDERGVIPTPPEVRWREFRIRALPVLVFCMAVMAALYLGKIVGRTQGIPGVAEGLRSVLSSPQVGLFQEALVKPFDLVQAGQPVAIILPSDPKSRLDLLQAGIEIARIRLQPSVADENAMNFEQIRVDWLRLKQELAVARVNLERAKNVLKRNESLYRKKLVSEDDYDLSLADRNIYETEVLEKTKAIAEIENRLNQLRPLGEPGLTNQPSTQIVDHLESELRKLTTNWNAITLKAPISGMVNVLFRQPGEHVVDGEPILSIHSTRAQSIIGFCRQPGTVKPEKGMKVQVSTRNNQRLHFDSEIREVGAQYESITNAVAYVRVGALVDVGLPILVDVPSDIHIRPGEIVDLIIHAEQSNVGQNKKLPDPEPTLSIGKR